VGFLLEYGGIHYNYRKRQCLNSIHRRTGIQYNYNRCALYSTFMESLLVYKGTHNNYRDLRCTVQDIHISLLEYGEIQYNCRDLRDTVQNIYGVSTGSGSSLLYVETRAVLYSMQSQDLTKTLYSMESCWSPGYVLYSIEAPQDASLVVYTVALSHL
jgi:hypothetical protein